MKVLIACPYPQGVAPSQRFRFEQFLDDPDIDFTIRSFWPDWAWNSLYRRWRLPIRVLAILVGMWRRMGLAFRVGHYDKVLVHREAIPLGPPWFEWVVVRLWKKPMIYDIDDAIWLKDPFRFAPLTDALKWRRKIPQLCAWSSLVISGNAWIGVYAGQFADRVVTIPTVVDTEGLHNLEKIHGPGPVTIGWTGSHSTLPYLKLLAPVFRRITREFQVRILVIADRDPKLDVPGYEFRPWQKQTEISDLMHIDIGLMPLNEMKWSRGKCGFKIIQYLALGIPAVVSPQGLNSFIVADGERGRICRTRKEWLDALRQLITDHKLRQRMGTRGREFIRQHYTTDLWRERFWEVLADA